MKFTLGLNENINTIELAKVLESMNIKILATPMTGINTFLFITNCGTQEQIEYAKQQARRR